MKRSPLKRKTGLKPGRPVPGTRKPSKPRKGSEPAYLAFIRRQPCAVCGAAPPSHAHHQEGERAVGGPKGMGQKAPDSTAVPLCNYCHRSWHDRGCFSGLPRVVSIRKMELTRAWLRTAWEALLLIKHLTKG